MMQRTSSAKWTWVDRLLFAAFIAAFVAGNLALGFRFHGDAMHWVPNMLIIAAATWWLKPGQRRAGSGRATTSSQELSPSMSANGARLLMLLLAVSFGAAFVTGWIVGSEYVISAVSLSLTLLIIVAFAIAKRLRQRGGVAA